MGWMHTFVGTVCVFPVVSSSERCTQSAFRFHSSPPVCSNSTSSESWPDYFLKHHQLHQSKGSCSCRCWHWRISGTRFLFFTSNLFFSADRFFQLNTDPIPKTPGYVVSILQKYYGYMLFTSEKNGKLTAQFIDTQGIVRKSECEA